MAQFTAQGRLKLLFNGDGVSSRLDHKDPFHFRCRSVQTYKRRVRSSGYSAGFYYASSSSSSSLSSRTNRCNVEARTTAGTEGVHDEYDDSDYDSDDDVDVFEEDGLSCFRGLVLDISYRSFLSFNIFFLHYLICTEII